MFHLDRSLVRGALGALLALSACADDLQPEPELDAGPAASSKVATVRNPDGTYTTRVDASAADGWTRLDLDSAAEATATTTWDLSAQRFHLMLNGGVSGSAGVEVAPIAAALAEVTTPPTSGWISDGPDGADDGGEPDYAFEQGDGWYAYDGATHQLTPRPMVWVVRSDADQVIALVIERYYDAAGSSGHFTLRWKPLGGGDR